MMKRSAIFALVIAWSCGGAEHECPEHQTRDPSDNQCYCDDGYERHGDDEPCTAIDYSEGCVDHAHRNQLGQCVCDDGYTERPAGTCSPEIPTLACCECLDRTNKYMSLESCLAVSPATCEAMPGTIVTTCYCWESCHQYCQDTLYPYAEPPNGCSH